MRYSSRRLLLLIEAVVLFLTNAACSSGRRLVSESAFDFMDTVSTVSLMEIDSSKSQDIFDICRRLSATLDARDETSEIARLNGASGGAVSLSPDTIALLQIGREAFDKSRGKFDITIGRLSLLWDFSSGEIPNLDDLKIARNSVNCENLELGDDWARLSNDAAIDLGGLAKGYALDLVHDYLVSENISSALVNLGGSVLAFGTKPDGKPWRVGIEKPFTTDNEIVGILDVSNKCVVTAGVYERSFTIDDILYHHILDPETGMPVKTDVWSATIIMDNGAWADAYSTICVLFGSSRALEFVESLDGVECVLSLSDGRILTSSGIGTTIPFDRQ